MARPNPVRRIMTGNLPSLTYQRRKSFRPSYADVDYAYGILNRHVFKNALKKPNITLCQIKKAWGMCHWEDYEQNGSSCTIQLSDKWFCPQWFLNTLAHEMVHQYQWDIYRWEHQELYGREMHTDSGGHGPSFFAWRDEFDYYGLNLKTWFRQRKWFLYQDFNKC